MRVSVFKAWLIVTGGALASPAAADLDDRFSAMTRVLDDRAAVQYAASDRLTPNYVEEGEAAARSAAIPGIPRYTGGYSGPYLALAQQAARQHGIPEDLFLRLVHQESGWNSGAVSHAGAIGLAQLMPGTAQILGVNPRDPQQNLEGGARYLAEQYRTFGNWRLALAAYNAGPQAVVRHGGIPPYTETQNYVRIILGST